MRQLPLVSVVMPAYNSEIYIAEAITSILKQSYTNIELIIVNDASTDGTMSIIKSFSDSRIRVLSNEKNSGVSFSLNRAIDCSQGKYIARMDADDVAFPDRIEKQVAFMERTPSCGVCGTFAKEYNGRRIFYHLTKNEDIQISLLFQNTFIHPTVIFRAELIKKHKYSEEFNFCEDYELWCRLSKETCFVNLPNVSLRYRVYGGSVSFSKKSTMEALRERIVRKLLLELEVQPTERELFLQMNMANVFDKKKELLCDKLFLSDLSDWLLILSEQNNKLKIYDANAFYSIMLFRLILACHFLKKYSPLYKKNVWKYISFCSFVNLLKLFIKKAYIGLFY